MFGRVPKNGAASLGTRPNISESHSEISTRVPFCIAAGQCYRSLGCPPTAAWSQRSTLGPRNVGAGNGFQIITRLALEVRTGCLVLDGKCTVSAHPVSIESASSCFSGGGKADPAPQIMVPRFYGKASDSPNTCSPDTPKTDHHCYTLAFYTSVDAGLTWEYASRIDKVPA